VLVVAAAGGVVLFGPERESGVWWVGDLAGKAVLGAALVSAWVAAGREALDRRRSRLLRREPGRPAAGVHPQDRPAWQYSPRADGSTGIELRLRGRRYVADFADDEKPGYRAAIAGITERLDGGVTWVDVNAAFAERVGREPFEEAGLLRPTVLDRLALRVSGRSGRGRTGSTSSPR
jgi:hypothetical protein